MDASLNWAALPLITEMLGIADPEKLVRQLAAIRERQRQKE